MLPLIIGGAATLGSMFANSAAAGSVSDARNRVSAEERARQEAFNAEAAKINTGAQNRYTTFDTQQADKSAQLGDYFKAPPSTGGPTVQLPTTSSDLVAREIAKKAGEAKTYGDQQSGALGNLRGFGDVLGEISRKQALDSNLVGQVGGFKKGSAGVTPYELEDANHAGDDMKFLGDILSGVGKIGLSAGLSGGMGSMFAPNPVDVGSATTYVKDAVPAAAWGPTYNSPIPASYLRFR